MRDEYLCLQTVVAAPYDDKYADGYIVQCVICGWTSAVMPDKPQAAELYDRAQQLRGKSCNFALYPIVGETPPYIVTNPNAVVVWRPDMPGLEPRKIALTVADFAKFYGKV